MKSRKDLLIICKNIMISKKCKRKIDIFSRKSIKYHINHQENFHKEIRKT